MEFATSRYYPVDERRKIIYLDTHPTKAACSSINGCDGMSGTHLNQLWNQYQQEGYQLKRLKPELRGGAGRGQGRKPKANPTKPIKVKVSHELHSRLDKFLATQRSRSGRYVSRQDFCSDLILAANLNFVAQEVKESEGSDAQITVSKAAHKRLDELAEKITKLRPDITVTLGSVFAAIARLALGGKSK